MSALIEPTTLSAFRWAAASVPGTSHAVQNTPCQDAYSIHRGSAYGAPYLVAALADGAGSARFAEQAAKIAVAAFTRFVMAELPSWGLDGLDDLALDAAAGVHGALRRLAREASLSPDEFATTLLAVIVTPETTSFLQIGDGGIVVRGSVEKSWNLVFRPQHGEFHNHSRFITDRDAFDHIEQENFEGPPGAICLFTDGIEDLVLQPGTLGVHPPLFDLVSDRLAREEQEHAQTVSHEIAAILKSADVRARTDDDTSLIAINFDEVAP